MKKEISLVKGRVISYLMNGIGWLLYGIFSMHENEICSVIAVGVLTICILMKTKNEIMIKQSDDEMSMYNLMRAKAITMDFLRVIVLGTLMIVAVIKLFEEIFPSINGNISASVVLFVPLILGITDIMIGLFFLKFERDGE